MLRQSKQGVRADRADDHAYPEAAEYGDRIVHMRDGQIVSPEEDPQWAPHHPAARVGS